MNRGYIFSNCNNKWMIYRKKIKLNLQNLLHRKLEIVVFKLIKIITSNKFKIIFFKSKL